MPRVWWPLVLVAATLLGSAPAPALFPAPEPLDDPFPLRRFRVTESQLADALKSLDGGATVRLPRTEFEARVRKAAASAARPTPRITEATYTATLTGGDLTGTAEFAVSNPSGTPAALPFDAFKPAVRSAAWADGREAVLGHLAASPAVWVERASDTLRVNWSLLGTPEGARQRFELRVPPTPAALLTLDLPADQTPTVGTDDALLTGPFPAADGRRAWRLRFGGRSRLEFTVRGPQPPDATFAEAALAARYDLTPDQVACVFEYDLEPSRGPVGEWLFDLDAALQVTDVVVNNRAAWRVEPGKTPADRKLRVTLRQPGAGGKVVVSAVAHPADGPLPTVRPTAAVVQAERVEIRLAPECQPRAWQPGDFRLTNSLVGADQSRTLLLVGGLKAAGSDTPVRRMPTLRTSDAADSFATTESVVWRPGRTTSTLTYRVGVRAVRGPLFRVAFQVPPGFAVVRAEPSDVVRYAGPSPTGFVVEFDRPLTAGQRAELRLDLRGPAVMPGAVPFPQVVPTGATQRDGWLSVCPDASFAGTVRTDPPATEADEFDLLDAPADALATYTFRAKEPAGWLTLTDSPSVSAIPPPRPVATAAPVAASTPPAASELYLVTTLGPRGDAIVVFGGSAVGGREWPVLLPAGAVVRAACVGGQWLDPARCHAPDSVLKLPLPAPDRPVRFEVRYRLPVSPGREVRSPVPDVPGGAAAVKRWWVFADGAVPSWPLRPHQRVPASDLPEFLGGPLDRATDAFVNRYDGDTVTAASRRNVTALGVGLALVAFLVARRRLLLSLALILAASAVVRIAPSSWLFVAVPVLVVAFAAAVLALWRAVRPAAVAVVLVGGAATAQAPAPAVVFVVGESVVAPRAVLDRLDALAKPFAPGVVVTSAAYTGQVTDGGASFVARFVVHSLQDGDAAVSLPLSGVRLEAATVNGTAALPVAVRPDLYAVPLPGRGRHEIEVRFVVAVAASGADREVKFGGPEAPITRVSFVAPAAARQVQAVGRMGAQSTSPRLDADLGSARTVHLRWRQGVAGAAVVKVREGCVWDVSESTHTLTACYQVRVEQGTVTGLRFDLPAELEPTRVAVRPLDAGTAQGVLRGWTLGTDRGGFRPLRLTLTGPTDGRLLVVLECSPRRSASRQPLLRFPRVHPNGATLEVDGLYGLRATEVGVGDTPRDGVTDFPADAITRDRELVAIPDLKLEPGVMARSFQPDRGKVPSLRPVLVPQGDGPTATVETTWRLGATRADGDGVVKWAAKEPLPLVEFTLAAKVLDVRGPDVAAWSQSADRVQVWLKKPAKTAEVEWAAVLGKAVEMPTPRLPDGRVTADELRVKIPDGWTARVERDRGWVASPGLRFTSDGTAPPVRVVVTGPGKAVPGP